MSQPGRCTDRFKPPSRRVLAVAAVLALSLATDAGAAPLFQSSFRSFSALPAADYYPIAIVDLNHDGLPDVVSAPRGGRQGLYVWLGLPDFGLSGTQYYNGGDRSYSGSRSLAIADLDGDGIPDALTGGDPWGYLHGRGDGSFGPFRNTADHDDIGAVAAADLNGDGIPDIVATSASSFQHLIVRLGRGGGVMDSAAEYRVNFSYGDPPTGLAIVDVNGDGLLDALVSFPTLGCWLLPGTPGGGFFWLSTYLGEGGRDLLSGDFNRDGHADFVTGRRVYLGRADGTFFPGPVFGAEVAGLADFDGDGNPDPIVLHDSSVEVMGGRGDGTFTSRGESPCGAHPRCVAAGDMNGDSRLDLVVSLAPLDGGGPAFSVLIGDGHGGLGALTTVPTGINPRKVLAADLTGDGIPDLVTAERGKRRVAVRPGLGSLRFGGAAEFETARGLTTIMLADLNGDGLPDLVALGDTSTSVSTMLGIPGGAFGPHRDFPAGGVAAALDAGDFDGDGHLDVATVSNVSWGLLRGDGAGSLGLSRTSWPGGQGVVATDFNNDGHLDLMVLQAGWNGSTFLLPGDGTGGFGWTSSLFHGFSAPAMAIGDLDRNGWKDVVTVTDSASSHGYALLRVALMGPGGGFSSIGGSADSIGSEPTDVLLADLDGDGNLDAAVACRSVNAVSVLRGHPNGTLSDRVDYGVADGPVSLAAADLDGDGAPELLVACDRSNVVTILRNMSRDLTTPTLVSLVESRVDASGAHLTWDAGGLPGLSATAERRDGAGPWAPLAQLEADGMRRLHLDDSQVEPGRTYFYRLTYLDQGVTRRSAESSVSIPARAGLALAGARPNPADASMRAAFSLPDAAPATLELHDLAGRLLDRREVGTLGVGEHVVALGEGLGLRPGIYWIRLVRGARSLNARAALVR